MNPVSLTQLEILHLYQNKTKAKTNNKKKTLQANLGPWRIENSLINREPIKGQSAEPQRKNTRKLVCLFLSGR